MRHFLPLIINVFLFLSLPQAVTAQVENDREEKTETGSFLPSAEGEKSRFSIYIEFRRAYIGGICILLNEDDRIKGSVFNEFGLSAIDFTYVKHKDRVEIHHVIQVLDRSAVRRVFRKNLRELMHNLQRGEPGYTDHKHHITYQMKPIH